MDQSVLTVVLSLRRRSSHGGREESDKGQESELHCDWNVVGRRRADITTGDKFGGGRRKRVMNGHDRDTATGTKRMERKGGKSRSGRNDICTHRIDLPNALVLVTASQTRHVDPAQFRISHQQHSSGGRLGGGQLGREQAWAGIYLCSKVHLRACRMWGKQPRVVVTTVYYGNCQSVP